MPQNIEPAKTLISFQEAFKLYEDGKHRRYELLFAVNGGAFAIAKLIGEKQPQYGKLGLAELAVGMILFTILMVRDICKFGKKWHGIGKKIEPLDEDYEIFGDVGRQVLIRIGILICLGWTLLSVNNILEERKDHPLSDALELYLTIRVPGVWNAILLVEAPASQPLNPESISASTTCAKFGASNSAESKMAPRRPPQAHGRDTRPINWETG